MFSHCIEPPVLLKDGDMRKLRGSYHVCFMGPSTFSYWCSVCVLMSHLPSFAHLCGVGDHHIIFVYESVLKVNCTQLCFVK